MVRSSERLRRSAAASPSSVSSAGLSSAASPYPSSPPPSASSAAPSSCTRSRTRPQAAAARAARSAASPSPSPSKSRASVAHGRASSHRGGGGRGSRPPPPPVLSAEYVEQFSSKNDLVRRLKKVVEALSDEDVEVDSPSYPGLDGLAAALVQDKRFLSHKDKEVRLHAVLACMEIFYLYAPEPPWDPREILDIFAQVISQLGNLSHTTSPTQSNFNNYFHLLEQLSFVKTGVVLVELCRGAGCTPAPGALTGGSGDSERDRAMDEEDAIAQEALESLADLIHVILDIVQCEHPAEVATHACNAISACVEEFDGGTIPTRVLDVLLSFVAKGPTLWVHPAIRDRPGGGGGANDKKVGKAMRGARKKEAGGGSAPGVHLESVPNHGYLVAANVIRRTEDKCSSPIAALLNGILNGEPHVTSRTIITGDTDDNANAGTVSSTGKAGGGKGGSDKQGGTNAEDAPNVYEIVYEMHRIAPSILTTVIGTIASNLLVESSLKRLRIVKLLGKLFYSPQSTIATDFHSCFKEWTRRSVDKDSEIRMNVLVCLVQILRSCENKAGTKALREEVTTCLQQMISSDPDVEVRIRGIHDVCDLAHRKPELTSPKLLRAVGSRVVSKNKNERKDALTGLAQLYHIHYMRKKVGILEGMEIDEGDGLELDVDLNVIHDILSSAQHNAAPTTAKKKRKSLDQGEEYYQSSQHLEMQWSWIPKIVMESASYTDQTDVNMRNRVIQILDDILLGTSSANAGEGGGDASTAQPLSPTSRAVGLTLMMLSLTHDTPPDVALEDTNAYKWLCALWKQRASLQFALGGYIDARSKIKHHRADSVAAVSANEKALAQLERVASLSAPLRPLDAASQSDMLQQIHSFKDKHIFRILSTIATPLHSDLARTRAFEDLPRRMKDMNDELVDDDDEGGDFNHKGKLQKWMKTLARRSAMGYGVNKDVTLHLLLLARACLVEGLQGRARKKKQDVKELTMKLQDAMSFLRVASLLSEIFPEMVCACGTHVSDDSCSAVGQGFDLVLDMYEQCRAVPKHHTRRVVKEIEELGILTLLTKILSKVAPSAAERYASAQPDSKVVQDVDRLHSSLVRMCSHDGTTEEARYAVICLSAFANAPGAIKDDPNVVLRSLLHSLTSKAVLSTSNKRIVSVLTSLASIAESAPSFWRDSWSEEGHEKRKGAAMVTSAVNFSMEILHSSDDNLWHVQHTASEEENTDESEEDEEISKKRPKKAVRGRCSNTSSSSKGSSSAKTKDKKNSSGKTRNTSSSGSKQLSSDSICSRICAAIDFLTAHIRAVLDPTSAPEGAARGQKQVQTSTLNATVVEPVLEALLSILQNDGLPPTSPSPVAKQKASGGRVKSGVGFCSTPSTRAKLRQCAALNLIRLCDASLQLESKYFVDRNPLTWHLIAASLLDEEKHVREVVVQGWMDMVSGQGWFRHGASGSKMRYAPSLKFLAMVVFCVDGETYHLMANGGAAQVDRRSHAAKSTALQCIKHLRRTCDVTEARCTAMGQESVFDKRYKMLLMPEFSLPYALHLLAHRRETPTMLPGEVEEAEKDYSSSRGKDPPADESGGTSGENGESDHDEHGEGDLDLCSKEQVQARYRQLKKRLKWLFEPLVHSLGDGADNISFLLRMTELLAKSYSPVGVPKTLRLKPNGAEVEKSGTDEGSTKKLRVVCAAAREVLHKFIKKDVNLTPYPGVIQIPSFLFVKTAGTPTERKSPTSTGLGSTEATSGDDEASVSSNSDDDNASNANFVEEEDFPKDHDGDSKVCANSHESLLEKSVNGRNALASGKAPPQSTSPQISKSIVSPPLQVQEPTNDDWNMSPIAHSDSPATHDTSEQSRKRRSSSTLQSSPPTSILRRSKRRNRSIARDDVSTLSVAHSTSPTHKLDSSDMAQQKDPGHVTFSSTPHSEREIPSTTTAGFSSTPLSEISDDFGSSTERKSAGEKKGTSDRSPKTNLRREKIILVKTGRPGSERKRKSQSSPLSSSSSSQSRSVKSKTLGGNSSNAGMKKPREQEDDLEFRESDFDDNGSDEGMSPRHVRVQQTSARSKSTEQKGEVGRSSSPSKSRREKSTQGKSLKDSKDHGHSSSKGGIARSKSSPSVTLTHCSKDMSSSSSSVGKKISSRGTGLDSLSPAKRSGQAKRNKGVADKSKKACSAKRNARSSKEMSSASLSVGKKISSKGTGLNGLSPAKKSGQAKTKTGAEDKSKKASAAKRNARSSSASMSPSPPRRSRRLRA